MLSGAFGAPLMDSHTAKMFSMDATFDESTVNMSPSPPRRRTSKKSIEIGSPSGVADIFNLDNISNHLPRVPISDDDETDSFSTGSLYTISSTDSSAQEDIEEENWSSESCTSDKKKVRFVVDEDGDIDEEISLQSYPKHDLTAEDLTTLWWTKLERHQLKASIPVQCRQIMQEFPQYRRAALKLCALSSRPDYASILETSAPTRDSLALLTRHAVRGLERPLFYRMALPRKSSKSYVSLVLRTQQLLRDLEDDVDLYSSDEKAQLIADQYRQNAQSAIRFAEILGAVDELEVKRFC